MASYNIGTKAKVVIGLATAQSLGRYAFISLVETIIKGAPRSGNWAHTSTTRRGKVGGSDPGGGLKALGVDSGSWKKDRQWTSAALRAARMEPQTIKRVKFKDDQPATEKQLDFASSLVKKAKSEASTDESPVVRNFFERAELPSDLTKWEASGIIDELRYGSPRVWVMAAADAVGGRMQGIKVKATQTEYSLLAFQSAAGYLANFLKLRSLTLET